MYINYFILEAGYAGFCWYAALWFYPLKLAGVKKVLHNHPVIKTHNCVGIGRIRMIWGFGKAQLSPIETLYRGAARAYSCTDYTGVPTWSADTERLLTQVADCSEDAVGMDVWPRMCCWEHGREQWDKRRGAGDLVPRSCEGSAPEQLAAALLL